MEESDRPSRIRVHSSVRGPGDAALITAAASRLRLLESLYGRQSHLWAPSRTLTALRILAVALTGCLVAGGIITARAAASPWARSLGGVVSVGGRTSPSEHLYLTAVSADGIDDATYRAGLRLMEQAKKDARTAALACLGISPVAPLRVRIRTGSTEGPSAGLMFALAIVDELEGGSLTRGRRIAGTGAIDAAGRVLPVGFVAEKASYAAAVGAEVFLVPSGEVDMAHDAPTNIRVIGVHSLDDALRALGGRGCSRTPA